MIIIMFLLKILKNKQRLFIRTLRHNKSFFGTIIYLSFYKPQIVSARKLTYFQVFDKKTSKIRLLKV